MRRHEQGILYAEVLVAVAILAMALVPATNAIYAGLRANEQFTNSTLGHFALMGRVEELRAEPFPALVAAALTAGDPNIATTYSDSPGAARRLVFLALYDADNADADNDPFTGAEADMMWVRVEIEGTSRGIETLVTP